jgi:hypothetical protein
MANPNKGPFKGLVPARTLVGEGTCGSCKKRRVQMRINSGGHVYAFCNSTEGGCGHSPQEKGVEADINLLARIDDWQGGWKGRLLEILNEQGHDVRPITGKAAPAKKPAPDPAPAKTTAPEPAPEPAPAPAKADDGEGAWWE